MLWGEHFLSTKGVLHLDKEVTGAAAGARVNFAVFKGNLKRLSVKGNLQM